jgi:cyclohexyl-isocyanide hydratase
MSTPISTSSRTGEPGSIQVVMLIHPGVTQLDFTGPLEAFQRVREIRVRLVWKSLEPVSCAALSPDVFRVLPTARFEDIGSADVLFVPGGPGMVELLNDSETLAFLRRVAPTARLVTSVCTGSIVLAAVGLLQGYRATTHWAQMQWLAPLGVEPVDDQRVVIDRDRITGAGVSSGIDFALYVIGELLGADRAQRTQLAMEYDPQPPFDTGSPHKAPPEHAERMREIMKPLAARTADAVREAAQRLRAAGHDVVPSWGPVVSHTSEPSRS